MREIEYEVLRAFEECVYQLEDDKVWVDSLVEAEVRHTLKDGREVRVFVKVSTELGRDSY